MVHVCSLVNIIRSDADQGQRAMVAPSPCNCCLARQRQYNDTVLSSGNFVLPWTPSVNCHIVRESLAHKAGTETAPIHILFTVAQKQAS